MAEFRKMRRFKQELTKEECIEVLKNEPRGIMAFHGENGYPYAIPLNHFYDEKDGKLYFHGAKEGLKLDLIKENNQVCFTVLDKGFKKEGDWALNIKSIVCLGHVEILTDLDKILDHCRMLSKKFNVSDEEIDDDIKRNMNNVGMFVFTIDRMTGKLVNES